MMNCGVDVGAPVGKHVILFVDDLNMPKLDRFGSQPPVELLRQYQDFRGFYDRQKLYWKQIRDMTICAACAPPGGGRNPITARMIRHFTMLCLPNPSEISLKAIFMVLLYTTRIPFLFVTTVFKPFSVLFNMLLIRPSLKVSFKCFHSQ